MIYSEDFECIEKMEIKRYDKNSFHLPRQGTNFLLKMLYLLGFEQYNIGF